MIDVFIFSRWWCGLQNKQTLYERLRKDYPQFIYKAYTYTETNAALEITYHFEIPGLGTFNPTWSISKLMPQNMPHNMPQNIPRMIGSDDTRLDELIFSLGMAELVSYWKLTCSPAIRVFAKDISPEQASWWIKLYTKGLGEFFYTNGIVAGDKPMMIQCETVPSSVKQPAGQTNEQTDEQTNEQMIMRPTEPSPTSFPAVLVPIGGGKDSIVTLELLRQKTERFGYIINPRKATLDTANTAGLAHKTVIAKRRLDPCLLTLNAQGFLNGHTPFSAIVAFSSVLAAYLHGIPYVALSNESSANEPTVANTDINHQYSKSVEFEKDFIQYEAAYIRSGVRYFSLLRPLSELRIAQLFSQYPDYYSIFRSCNAGSKTDSWCGICPKCLFVYIILAPFIERDTLNALFNKDMLADTQLTDTLDKLTGLQPEKPFECVGQRDEVCYALRLTAQKYDEKHDETYDETYDESHSPYPPLLDYFLRHDARTNDRNTSPLDFYDDNHTLPPFFLPLL